VTILIADDEKFVRYSLISMLKEIGIPEKSIFSSVNGEDFIKQLKRYSPDIAFVDIKMPKLNGIRAIKRGRKISPYTRYYILTCYPQFDYAKQAIDIGVSGYILKPVSPGELNDIIDKYTDVKRIQYKKINNEFENYINALSNKTISIGSGEAAYIESQEFCGVIIFFDSHSDELEKAKMQVLFCENLRRAVEPFLSRNTHFAFLTLENGNLSAVIGWESTANKNETDNRKSIILKKIVEFSKKMSNTELSITLFVTSVCKGYVNFMEQAEKLNSFSYLRIIMGLGKVYYLKDISETESRYSLKELAIMFENLTDSYNSGNYLWFLETVEKIESLLMFSKSIPNYPVLRAIGDYLRFSIGLAGNNSDVPSAFIKNLKSFGAALLYKKGNRRTLQEGIISHVKNYVKENYMSAPSKANINKLDNPARVTANHRHETEL